MLQRLLIVWGVALLIALGTWVSSRANGYPSAFDVSLVYAYAISTFIWLLTDVPRFAFKRLLRSLIKLRGERSVEDVQKDYARLRRAYDMAWNRGT